MKDLILDNIEEFRTRENGFEKGTMRWSKWYIEPQLGVVRIYTKKGRNEYKNAIRLCDMDREAFAALNDDILLTTYTNIVRQMSKQM